MFELVIRYATTFAMHALLGAGIVLTCTWSLYRIGRGLGWNTLGPRGPVWLASVIRITAFIVLFIATVVTGLQTGTIHALAKAVEQGSQELALKAALEAGKPLGIKSADQKLALADAERLISEWAPQLMARGRAEIGSNTWWRKAADYWRSTPGVLRNWIASKGPRTQTTPRELVQYAWRNGAQPLVASAKWQALLFAYGLAALMIGLLAIVEWSWLAYSRRPQAIAPDGIS